MSQHTALHREFEGKKILILGYGREGKSTFNFLLRHGVEKSQIVIMDRNIDNLVFESPLPPNPSSVPTAVGAPSPL